MTDNAANISISELGSSSSTTGYRPDSREYREYEYRLTNSAINTALAILRSPDGKDSLYTLANEYDYAMDMNKRWDPFPELAGPEIGRFLFLLCTFLPKVVVDRSLANIDLLGATSKLEWKGGLEKFNPRECCQIHLNGPKMHNMVTAAIDKDEQLVCAFHFMLVTTLIHELGGHGLVAFLGNGSYDIPFSRITTPHVHPKDAGLRLQELLFGGTVHFYRGSGQGADDGQAGIPYLMKQVRGRYVVERIESRVIVDMYHGRFNFPIKTYGPSVDPKTMQLMGFNSIDPPVSTPVEEMHPLHASFVAAWSRQRLRSQELAQEASSHGQGTA